MVACMSKVDISVSSNEAAARRVRELVALGEAEEARHKKNANFMQVEKRSLRSIRELFAQNATAGNLLFILAEKDEPSERAHVWL